MCKETEKLIKILQGSENPTDMALVILANKIDSLDKKLDDFKKDNEQKVKELADETKVQFKSLESSTQFARWLEHHKKPLTVLVSLLVILATCGISGIVSYLKNILGI